MMNSSFWLTLVLWPLSPSSRDLVSHVLFVGIVLWVVFETGFGIIFYSFIVPRANQTTTPIAYRDYGRDRHQLFLKIMRRIERTCQYTNESVRERILATLGAWFHVTKNPSFVKNVKRTDTPGLSRTTTPDSSDDDEGDDDDESRFIDQSKELIVEPHSCLCKEDMDSFLAWAFFGKDFDNLVHWEQKELALIYHLMKQHHDISFPNKEKIANHQFPYHCRPRRMTLEPANSNYRPLIFYAIVYFVKMLGGIILSLYGYRRFVAGNGLVAWHRPSVSLSSPTQSATSNNKNNSLLPLLFFHGIVPAGKTAYLGMLSTLASERERDIFLFENRSISCELNMSPLSEEETVDGVLEILNRCDHADSKLSLVGHSFGSCAITWLLASGRLPNVAQVVLMDPVAILLSEHDVLVNFMYTDQFYQVKSICVEKFLRRDLAWYNSEMWLEDHIDKERCQVIFCLSENDEIIDANKVRLEILQHQLGQLVFWEGAGHGNCVSSPSMWRQVKQIMTAQELKIVQGERT